MAKDVKHFVLFKYADGLNKTQCGIKVPSSSGTKTNAYITCKRCKDSLRAEYGTKRRK